MKENHSSLWYEVGSAQYPSKRDAVFLPTPFDWLDVKQDADSLETDAKNPTLWRIHDGLYDFSNFKNHPGGYSFIDFTKNTDITELFESSHVDIEKAKGYLSKYYVKKASKPRNSRSLTFHPDGFYCVLRKRVFEMLKVKQAESKSKKWPVSKSYLQSTNIVHDVLLLVFVALMAVGSCAVLTNEASSGILVHTITFGSLIVAGFILSLLMMCAHNYFHLRDNWRMYSFDISMFSSHEWRISHAYSHHAFPNTMLDYEVAAFEPFLRFLPYADKGSLLSLIGTFLFVTIMMPLAMHTMFLKRMVLGALLPLINPKKVVTEGLRRENFLPVLVMLCSGLLHWRTLLQLDAVNIAGKASGLDWTRSVAVSYLSQAMLTAALRCSVMYISCSTCFLYLSLAGTHHHPNVWHAGDPATVAINHDDAQKKKQSLDRAKVIEAGMDWGTLQLLATGRRPSCDRHLWSAAVIFGQHALHHLFPTVDLCFLYDVEPILKSTCREFGLERLIDTSASGTDDRRSLSNVQCVQGTLYQAFIGNVGHEENFFPEVWNYWQQQQLKKKE